MKIKTIRKIITHKLNDWVDTLPKGLAEIVKPEIVVSGGCITSMLLKEPINDFDIYIKDVKVLEALANHYYLGNVLNGNKRDEYLEDYPDIAELQDFFTDGFASEPYVRIFNLKPGQIKLDIKSRGERVTLKPEEMNAGLYKVAFLSQNAISLTDDLQIVLRFSGSVGDIHSTFDFVHATNYFTYEDGLVTNPRALESIITKELKYQGSKYPVTSIIRMKKFIGRGWTMNAGEILKMVFQCGELNLKDPFILEEQLIGVDVAYFATLINILRGTAPELLTTGYLHRMIDEVFDRIDTEDQEEIKTESSGKD